MAEKQDFLYVVLAIGIVLIIALIVKPAATGEPAGIRWGGEPEPTVTPTWTPTFVPATATPTPTPVPTWNGKPQAIGFVDPGAYQVPAEETRPNLTIPPPVNASGATRWVTYATIDGKWSGTTGIVRIPFPRWRLDYSEITTSNDELPRFNCQVMDAEDPNRFVRIITLNFADFLGMKERPDLKKEQWTSTFYEGNHDYYFVINTRCIDSYTLKIQVPEAYVGR
ncbi:hypothetical protein F8E02_10115 [Methanoculleus sp. Wushi-C6]|uniref:Uncharacterized protein n=1 Tax=Methanoculleus caldifontis TaxID=2651577 RepID=A0ABU3X2R1_9EURY|nr:hypothetical protein [Methanoculleus sp. Wushi-C6]MDV2482348.1 hypothetical protein [Methanoculleus sp. Wushi-C6]